MTDAASATRSGQSAREQFEAEFAPDCGDCETTTELGGFQKDGVGGVIIQWACPECEPERVTLAIGMPNGYEVVDVDDEQSTLHEALTDGGVDQDDGDAAQRTRHQYFARSDAECSRWNCFESAWFRLVTWNGWPCEFCPRCAAQWDRDGIAQIDTEFHSQNPTLVADGGVGYHGSDSTDDTDLSRANPDADDTTLPEIRFVDRFTNGTDVFYAAREENGVRLYRVTGKTTIARSLLAHDAVIHDTAGDACITTPSYEERYKTIDLNHHMAGRKASIRADRILDEPVITLAEVDRV